MSRPDNTEMLALFVDKTFIVKPFTEVRHLIPFSLIYHSLALYLYRKVLINNAEMFV